MNPLYYFASKSLSERVLYFLQRYRGLSFDRAGKESYFSIRRVEQATPWGMISDAPRNAFGPYWILEHDTQRYLCENPPSNGSNSDRFAEKMLVERLSGLVVGLRMLALENQC